MLKCFSHFVFLFVVLVFSLLPPVSFAQDSLPPAQEETVTDNVRELAEEITQEIQPEENVTETPDSPVVPTLTEDLKQARDIIMKNAGDNGFARGLIIALLQPIFLASMFCLGLLAGQMSERLKHIWVLPVILYAATVIGAFITTYHAEWKPSFENLKYLSSLQSTEAVCVAIGVVVGVSVGFALGIPVIFAMVGAIGIGLILGFSQSSEISNDHVMRFWAGFGLTGLLVNIFGIGFETFFQSINLKMVTRLVGVATAVLAMYLGVKLF